MQTFKSEYGRKGCRVDDLCPTRAVRHWLGSIHVGKSDAAIESLIRVEVNRQTDARWTPLLTEQTVRYALWQHHENRAEYGYVMGGVS